MTAQKNLLLECLQTTTDHCQLHEIATDHFLDPYWMEQQFLGLSGLFLMNKQDFLAVLVADFSKDHPKVGRF